MATKSQEIAADVAHLLRARNSLLWIVTREEARVERYLFEAAAAANYVPLTWDCGQGVADMSGKIDTSIPDSKDIGAALTTIFTRSTITSTAPSAQKRRGVWIMRDAHKWLEGVIGIQTVRQLRNLARSLPSTPRDTAQAVIVLSPSGEVPPELAGHATVLEWPLPDRDEIAGILDAAINSLPEYENDKAGNPDKKKPLRSLAAPNGTRDQAIDAAVGLSGEEASACYAKSLVSLRRIDPMAVNKEKKRVVARERVLEWYDPIPGGMDAVGGLENLKSWLGARKQAYSKEARDYGLPSPKGIMLFGIQGCGKSLTAKAVATLFGVPLLKMDMGALKSKFVGDSEANIRKAFRVIEAIGRCVVWLDEVEKALQGATVGAADGGVSADALGSILTWMNERQGEAFVVATANDLRGLPPEFLRKGRFDEIWWVDLPSETERKSVLQTALKANKRSADGIDLLEVALACRDFTGAEIAAIVPEAMFTAFADKKRMITTEDLVKAAGELTPLSKTAGDRIDKMREWAKGKTKPASKSEDEVEAELQAGNRQLDM